jgi:hypothetical protein
MNMKDLFRYKNQKKFMMKVFTSLLLVFVSCIALSQRNDTSVEQDKAILSDLYWLIQMNQELNGLNDNRDNVMGPMNVTTPINIDANNIVLFKDRDKYQLWRQQIDEAILETTTLFLDFKTKRKYNSNDKDTKTIEPEILPECNGITPDTTRAALVAKEIAVGIIAGAKYTCNQGALVGNAASGCAPLEIVAQYAKSVYETAEFCSREKTYAYDFSVFDIMKNMIKHMNEFIDDTQVSSRATVESVATLQDSLDTANTSVNDAFPIISYDLNTALTGLNQSIQKTNTINAQATSLLQRVQINQIEIENSAITSSNVKQTLIEARTDTQNLINTLAHIQNLMNQMSNDTLSLLKESENSQIEYVMARDSAQANLIYQIPAFKGGLLDRSREILITKMSAIDTAGGDTSSSRSLFDIGNSHYNNQQYKAAYSQYSLAYQALLESSF